MEKEEIKKLQESNEALMKELAEVKESAKRAIVSQIMELNTTMKESELMEKDESMLKVVLEDNSVDAVTVTTVQSAVLTRAIADISKYYNKPITVCLNVPSRLAHAESSALEEIHIPTYPLPERAVTGLAGLVRYGGILRATS